MSDAIEATIGDEIRQTHPYGYRCGEWAVIRDRIVIRPVSVRDLPPRECWRVEFPDGAVDEWPIQDRLAGYEVRGRR